MSKNKKLIQNVDVFYKLALYSDRSSFLKSLAQTLPVAFPHDQLSALLNEISTRLASVSRAWQNADRASTTEANSLLDYSKAFSRFAMPSYFSDKKSLDAATHDIKRWASIVESILAKAPAEISSEVNPLREALSKLEQNIAGFYRNHAGLAYSGEPTGESAPATSTNTEKAKPAVSKFPSIPREIQEMLNKILVPAGLAVPFKVDGSLGPDTQKAIDVFRKAYNVPNNFSLPEVFEVIRNTAARL